MSDLAFVVPEGADPISRQLRLLVQVLQEDAPSVERIQAQARICGRVAAALDAPPGAIERLVDTVMIPGSDAGSRLVDHIRHAMTFGYRASALMRVPVPGAHGVALPDGTCARCA